MRADDRRDGALHPEPPDPDEAQQNEDVHGEMHQGEHRENSEAPEPGELILHGARERHDRHQGKRQVERARLRLVKEGDIAVDERDRQRDRQGSAAEADRQGGADAFRDGRLLRHDEILRAFSCPRREEHAENACEHDAQGEAAASFRQQRVGQETLDREAEDDRADRGREHDGGILSAGRARTERPVRLFRGHGFESSDAVPAVASSFNSSSFNSPSFNSPSFNSPSFSSPSFSSQQLQRDFIAPALRTARYRRRRPSRRKSRRRAPAASRPAPRHRSPAAGRPSLRGSRAVRRARRC